MTVGKEAKQYVAHRLEDNDLFFNSVRVSIDRMVTLVKHIYTAHMVAVRAVRYQDRVTELFPGCEGYETQIIPKRSDVTIKLKFSLPSDLKPWLESDNADLVEIARIFEASYEAGSKPDVEIDAILASAGNPKSVRAQAKVLYRAGMGKMVIVRALTRRTGKKVAYQQVWQATFGVVPRAKESSLERP